MGWAAEVMVVVGTVVGWVEVVREVAVMAGVGKVVVVMVAAG